MSDEDCVEASSWPLLTVALDDEDIAEAFVIRRYRSSQSRRAATDNDKIILSFHVFILYERR